jgi:hypothetical protein
MRPFGDCGVVGKIRLAQMVGLFVRGQDRPEWKTLRRLRGMKPVPGHRLFDHAGGRLAFQRVGDRQSRQRALALAYANSAAAGGAFELFQNGPVAYITSNTIFDNEADSATPDTGGLALFTTNLATIYVLSNNIIWGNTANGALDLSVSNARHVRVGNDVGTIDIRDGAPPPLLVENEQNVAPGFASCALPCLGFELARSSPLVDAGNSTPSGGLSALDLAGKPRVIGPHVDIGAFENERLFANGFD